MGEVVGAITTHSKTMAMILQTLFVSPQKATRLPTKSLTNIGVEQPIRHKKLIYNIVQVRLPLTFGLFDVMVPKKQSTQKDKKVGNEVVKTLVLKMLQLPLFSREQLQHVNFNPPNVYIMVVKIMQSKESLLAHATSHVTHNEEEICLLEVQEEDVNQAHVAIEAVKVLRA
jgi:hypothetical protein